MEHTLIGACQGADRWNESFDMVVDMLLAMNSLGPRVEQEFCQRGKLIT